MTLWSGVNRQPKLEWIDYRRRRRKRRRKRRHKVGDWERRLSSSERG